MQRASSPAKLLEQLVVEMIPLGRCPPPNDDLLGSLRIDE